MFVLRQIQLWRNSAEIDPGRKAGLPEHNNWSKLAPAAGPSNNYSVAKCQNRYPSLFRGSVPYPGRPSKFFWRRRGFAQIGGLGKKRLAFAAVWRAYTSVNQHEESLSACIKRSGLLLSQLLSHCQPVATLCWNRASWAPVPVPQLPPFWAAMSPRALRSAGPGMCFIASKTHRCVNVITPRRRLASAFRTGPSGLISGWPFVLASRAVARGGNRQQRMSDV